MEGKIDEERSFGDCGSSDKPSSDERLADASVSNGRSGHQAEAIQIGLFASKIDIAPWNPRDVIIAAALCVPAGLICNLALAYILVQLSVIEDSIFAAIIGSIGLSFALLAGAWFFGTRRYRVSLTMLGLRRTTAKWFILLPMAALAIGLSTTGAYAIIVDALGIDILAPEQNLEDVLGQYEGVAQLATFAIIGIIAPFSEEVFFRGFLLAALAPLIGGLRGAAMTSAIFAVAHLQVGTLFPIFVMGMLLAWLYLRSGSLWPAIVAHAAQNILALIFLELSFDMPTAFLQV